MTQDQDARYLQIIIDPIRVCAAYKPRLGKGRAAGVSLAEFQRIYQSDPFYAWFGLDNPLMYAAHKAAGGMTSIYRQIGIGCERLFRQIIRDRLGLTEDAARWSYAVPTADGKSRTLYLDGRINLADVSNADDQKRMSEWMARADDTKYLGRDNL